MRSILAIILAFSLCTPLPHNVLPSDRRALSILWSTRDHRWTASLPTA